MSFSFSPTIGQVVAFDTPVHLKKYLYDMLSEVPYYGITP